MERLTCHGADVPFIKGTVESAEKSYLAELIQSALSDYHEITKGAGLSYKEIVSCIFCPVTEIRLSGEKGAFEVHERPDAKVNLARGDKVVLYSTDLAVPSIQERRISDPELINSATLDLLRRYGQILVQLQDSDYLCSIIDLRNLIKQKSDSFPTSRELEEIKFDRKRSYSEFEEKREIHIPSFLRKEKLENYLDSGLIESPRRMLVQGMQVLGDFERVRFQVVCDSYDPNLEFRVV